MMQIRPRRSQPRRLPRRGLSARFCKGMVSEFTCETPTTSTSELAVAELKSMPVKPVFKMRRLVAPAASSAARSSLPAALPPPATPALPVCEADAGVAPEPRPADPLSSSAPAILPPPTSTLVRIPVTTLVRKKGLVVPMASGPPLATTAQKAARRGFEYDDTYGDGDAMAVGASQHDDCDDDCDEPPQAEEGRETTSPRTVPGPKMGKKGFVLPVKPESQLCAMVRSASADDPRARARARVAPPSEGVVFRCGGSSMHAESCTIRLSSALSFCGKQTRRPRR